MLLRVGVICTFDCVSVIFRSMSISDVIYVKPATWIRVRAFSEG
jgi:hypothetical protein